MDMRKTTLACICCAGSIALACIYGWIQNGILFPQFVTFFPTAREIDTVLRAVLYLAVAAIANRYPGSFRPALFSVAAAGLMALASALLYASVLLQSPILTLTGIAAFEIGHTWSIVIYGLALCMLPTPKHTAVAVAAGTVLGLAATGMLPLPPFAAGMVTFAMLPIGAMALCQAPASKFLQRLRTAAAPFDMEVANPQAFLKPTSSLFACILLFSIASGYGLTLNEIDNTPNTGGAFEWLPALVAGAAIILYRKPGAEDALFSFSVLLVVAGFLLAPIAVHEGAGSANVLLRGGNDCFDILVWMVMAAITARNPFALLPALGIASALHAIGIVAGAVAGHTVNDLMPVVGHSASAMTALALFAFIAFLWLGFRTFSFEETVHGIETPPDMREAPIHEEHPLEERCQQESARCGLSERETEIFIMLARGRNVSFIQEHFVISRNTVKTHVKRIYKKLDVHSQQELIDLVSPESE